MRSEIKAEKEVLKEIFEKFWFLVPEYQRSYVWTHENILELLEDLYSSYENNEDGEYFLGSLVLKKTDEIRFEEYELLDGQQRLTTFLLILSVVRDLIEDPKYKATINEKIQQEENVLEGTPARERIKYKIRDNVEVFMKEYILKLEGTKLIREIEDETWNKNLSIHHMSNALLTILEFLNKFTIDKLMRFTSFMLQKSLFICVSTDNAEDAFRLFTVLNNRGLSLSSSDILKSMNIGILETERNKISYARKWEEIEQSHEDFDRFLYFIRNILAQDKPKEELLKEFDRLFEKGIIEMGEKFLDLIIEYNEIYQKIIELEDDRLDNEYRNLITIMKKGLQSDEWISPILLYFKTYKYKDLNKFLRYLEYKFSSEWICGNSPSLRRDRMNNVLKVISESKTTDEIFKHKEIFSINEKELLKSLKQDVYLKNFKRYLLLKIEYLLHDNSVHINNYEKISIEHILPQNPSLGSEWERIFNIEDRELWTNKLANLVLINRSKNSKLGNLEFKLKKEKYLSKSMDIFASSKIFSQVTEWNTETLKKREEELIDLLVKRPF